VGDDDAPLSLFVMIKSETSTATAMARAATKTRAPFQVRRGIVMIAALMVPSSWHRTVRRQ
jgi:hypothetical protein